MSSHRCRHVHQTLRHATAADHHAMDHHPLLQRLTAGDLTRDQYAQSLLAMYRPHARLERLVHDSRHLAESGLGLSARVEWLGADILELGWPVPEIPHFPREPLQGRATWWGRVYVLEGSRLGGAVIAKRVRASLGDAVPRRFFAGASGPHDFNALLAMLEGELEQPDELSQAVAGAQAAFADYRAGLDASYCGEDNAQLRPRDNT